ncbi:helix-turn-helix transcriptional regulator [Maribacter sp.]|nr:helix-turn-helix transcriptional regulator [Maribacter sp.]
MDYQAQFLFLFSALGAINGLVLSFYFVFFTKRKHPSNYFLGALLFVLSIRIIKSVFFFFNPDMSQLFIQVGLSACILIGPFLYLYTLSISKENRRASKRWMYHTVPFILIITIAWFIIPYREYRHMWGGYLIRVIYLQWLVYIIISGFLLKEIILKIFSKNKKLDDFEIFHLTVYFGTAIIWIAYFTSRYTSYIVGALSFSFVFYLLLLMWIFKKNKNSVFFEKEVKYANKKIDTTEANAFAIRLDELMIEKQLFKNPDLKLSDVANELNILPHYLSQFLNDNVGKRFSSFLNEYRIKSVENEITANQHLTLEAIGQKCGFKSNSTFYTAFKKIKGITPAQFKKQRS